MVSFSLLFVRVLSLRQAVCLVKVLSVGTHSHIHIPIKEIVMDFQSVKCDPYASCQSQQCDL